MSAAGGDAPAAHALAAFVARSLDRPAPPDVEGLAREIAGRPGVAAVLFYGNRLRDPAAGGLADLYVLTDRDSAWSGRGLAALGCRLLPPNVYHLPVPAGLSPPGRSRSSSGTGGSRDPFPSSSGSSGRSPPAPGDAPVEPGHDGSGGSGDPPAGKDHEEFPATGDRQPPLTARPQGRAAPDLPPEGAMAMPPAASSASMLGTAESGPPARPALQVGRCPPLPAGESAGADANSAAPIESGREAARMNVSGSDGVPAGPSGDANVAGHGTAAGAKVAVMRLDAFHRRMRRDSRDTTLWARFAQPAALLHARDAAARAAVIDAVAEAWRTAAWWADRLADGSDRWAGLFAATYMAELRPEGAARPGAIVARAPELYAEVDRLLPRHPVPEAEKAAARRDWRRRCQAGRALNAARLVKAAMTFRGGAAYALDKIQRHAGPEALSPWERRLPWLAAPLVLVRLLRRGGLR